LAFLEVEKIRNAIELTYNLLGSEEHDQVLVLSKKQNMLDLKKIISEKIGLGVDEFKIFKSQHVHKLELKDETESLDHCLGYMTKITIEKGKPLAQGEITLKFKSFDLNFSTKQVHDLFCMFFHGKTSVQDAKKSYF